MHVGIVPVQTLPLSHISDVCPLVSSYPTSHVYVTVSAYKYDACAGAYEAKPALAGGAHCITRRSSLVV